MATNDDDPTRAALRVAESVVTLVRAEVGLFAAQARATSGRLLVTLALTGAALFSSALAAVVVVFTPILWAFRPTAALGTLAVALAFAVVTALVAWKRWRTSTRSQAGDERSSRPAELPGRNQHVVPR